MTAAVETHWTAAQQRADGLDALPAAVDPLALALNENPFPPLPAVRAALARSIAAANRFPPLLPDALRTLIAERLGVLPVQVVLVAGATGVMLQMLHVLSNRGDPIVMASPTLEGHPMVAGICGLCPVMVPLDQEGHHDLAAMADAARHARIVVVCRPHNPTGMVEPAAAVERFLCRVPGDTLVIIDEAYQEFVGPAHRIDSVGIIKRFPNVVVLRTFSKAYGLAGLRIGYAFGSPHLTDKVWATQLPFGMAITSLVAVAASYCAESQLQQRIRRITVQRRNLRERLRAMGINSTDAHANFIYLGAGARPWREAFDNSGIRVRHYPDGGVRITVGCHASTRAVLTAVRGLS